MVNQSNEMASPDIEPANLGQARAILSRLNRWLDREERWPRPEEALSLFQARPTDVAANKTARTWSQRYLQGNDTDRYRLLSGLVQASEQIQPREDHGLKLFRRLYAHTDGLQLLVELRADMLRWRHQLAGIDVLESELKSLLSSWFDVGMLELRRISWDSPASLLEKLIIYEAVHEIRSWDDLRNRVADHRRCYAFFHPRMEKSPLIFVEVAFSASMASDVQALLDPAAPSDDPDKARWAIFYSISNTQAGLRGISFGNFLLKRVVEELLREFPRLKGFATLSPIPGFTRWLARQDHATLVDFITDKSEKQRTIDQRLIGTDWLNILTEAAETEAPDAIQRIGLRLAGHYLKSMRNNQPVDPVARFHLGNGARIERVNWGADTSAKGIKQSCAIMANYVYDLDQLDDNLAQLAEGKIKTGRALRWL